SPLPYEDNEPLPALWRSRRAGFHAPLASAVSGMDDDRRGPPRRYRRSTRAGGRGVSHMDRSAWSRAAKRLQSTTPPAPRAVPRPVAGPPSLAAGPDLVGRCRAGFELGP